MMMARPPPDDNSDSDFDADGNPKKHIVYAYDAAAEREKERQRLIEKGQGTKSLDSHGQSRTVDTRGQSRTVDSLGRSKTITPSSPVAEVGKQRKKSSVDEKAPVLPMVDMGGAVDLVSPDRKGSKGKGKAANGR